MALRAKELNDSNISNINNVNNSNSPIRASNGKARAKGEIMKTLAIISVALAIVFAISYMIIDVAFKATMDSLKVEDTTPTTLEVKENYGLQTDNHYKLQPAVTPQEQK